jgi:ABC-2 type transport system permease protein
MLWYKAWRESRMRFILGAGGLALVCALIVLYRKSELGQVEEPVNYIEYVWVWTYRGGVKNLFILFVPLLGLGGLLRERTLGTAGFTLSFPVTRLRLVAVRAIVGFSEMAALALLPAVLIPTLSPLVHQSYPFFQSIQFSLLWIFCGSILFAVAFLLSNLLAGEYSALVTSYVGLFFYIYSSRQPALRAYPYIDLWRIMGGYEVPYFRSDTYLLVGPLPWKLLCTIALVALAFLVVAGGVTQRQDFS